jgi:PAS domain S-box-containing protein
MEGTGPAGGRPRQAEPAQQVEGRGDDAVAGTEFCRAVLAAIEDRAIFGLGRDGRITSWNDGARTLTGYQAEEAIGRPYTDLLADESEAATTLSEIGRGLAREVWWRKRSGERVCVFETVTPLERRGASIGYAVVARDLTGRLDEEEARVASRAREDEALARERELRTAVQAAERSAAFLAEASSILVATSLNFESTIRGLARLAVSRLADWCVVYTLMDDGGIRRMEVAHRDPRQEEALRGVTNTRLVAEPGHPVLEAIGHHHVVMFDEVPDTFWQGLARAKGYHGDSEEDLGGGPGMVVPLFARGKALGAVAFVSAREAPPYDQDDLELAEELGRRAALAIDNARLYRDAQEANRAKADFLAIMSHELRTPLNAIMGYTDLIDAEISGPITPKQRTQIGRVRAGARHLLQLIEEILSFARMEAGGEELRLEVVTVKDLMDEVDAVIGPLAAAKNLPLRIERDGERTAFQTDPGKARQILVNILSNAVKFTERGEITLSFRREDADLVFEVRDTGIGIGAGNLERIFDPFWQGERPMTRRVGGTGLGLSVSRRYARLLRGEIEVESEAHVGTVVRIRLPIRAGVALDRAFPGRGGTVAVS